MIINGFESGFLRPFYGLLLRCRQVDKPLTTGVAKLTPEVSVEDHCRSRADGCTMQFILRGTAGSL